MKKIKTSCSTKILAYLASPSLSIISSRVASADGTQVASEVFANTEFCETAIPSTSRYKTV